MFSWLLVFHILGVVFWIGGLLLATKLLALHGQSESAETKSVLARLAGTLLLAWGLSGILVVTATGGWLMLNNPAYYLRSGWMHGKLFLVVVLVVLHAWLYLRAKRIGEARSRLTRGQSAALHGGVTLIAAAILVLVFTKP